MKPTTSVIGSCCVAIILAALCGCVPSTDLQPGQIDQFWSLNKDITPLAPLAQPTVGAHKLPAHWIEDEVGGRPDQVRDQPDTHRHVDRRNRGRSVDVEGPR